MSGSRYDIDSQESFTSASDMYSFLLPTLWLEHITFHCIMDNGLIYLKNHLVENNLTDEQNKLSHFKSENKLLKWCTNRLIESKCSCWVCKT